MTTLCIFMLIDYITGIIVAAVFQNSPKTEEGGLSSNVGWKGLFRKGMTLLIVFIGTRLDLLMGSNYVRDGLCIAFITNELISIVENAGLMGIPVPDVLKKIIEVLKTKTDGHKDE